MAVPTDTSVSSVGTEALRRATRYRRDPAKFKVRTAAWRAKNPDYLTEYAKKYYQVNKEERLSYAKAWRLRAKQEVLRAYGNKCACCNETQPEFLSIDHINGGGSTHSRAIGGLGTNLYSWLRKNNFPLGFQVLCMNCNFAKGTGSSCPHQRISNGNSQ